MADTSETAAPVRTGEGGGDSRVIAQWLSDSLPARLPINRRTEADYYGASRLIGGALGYPTPPRSIASWKHGVTYVKDLAFPELLLTEGNRLTRHLVTNEPQAVQLRDSGFARVHAAGAPFLYAVPGPVSRLPQSLLVMPAHTLSNTTHLFDEDAYVDQIASIRDRFSAVVACISSPCIRLGHWTRAFEKRGIPWIAGADSSDGSALQRMAVLFKTFEFVTTNYLGSYVAYAAHSGCRVSIWGRFAESRLEDFRGVPWYEKNWHKAQEVFEKSRESYLRDLFPWLFTKPWCAEPGEDWAREILGYDQRREAAEIGRLLGWTTTGRLEDLLHAAARGSAGIGRASLRRVRRIIGGHGS